jgi:predicted nucleic acid-binding protein
VETKSLIYLDICCLKRPFDDQRSERVRLESAAVAVVVAHAEAGQAHLVHSPAHDLENRRNPREDRRLATSLWLNGAKVDVGLTDATAERARQLVELGLDAVDALHIAFAEAAGAAWFVTTDDRILAFAARHAAELDVSVANPQDVSVLLSGSR